jgi:hypothetical protein
MLGQGGAQALPDWTALTPVVFASSLPMPERYFSGYGFEGLDFVIGPQGLAAFEAVRGRPFSGRDDGCYMTLSKTAGQAVIAADPQGMCKLFVYTSRAGWAVSNSFAGLMDHVIAEGWPVTPHYGVLDGWTLPQRSFWNPCSAQTVVREIRLLGAGQHLVIRSGKAFVEQHRPLMPPAQVYETAVTAYLRLWLGRILGMAQSDQIALCAELTGGVDSRTAAAFILHLRARGLLAGSQAVPIFCAKSAVLDHSVAQAVAARFGFELGMAPAGQPRGLTAQARFAGWRAFSLGMYMPPYLPGAEVDLRRVTIGGHGGERLRAGGTLSSIPAHVSEHAHKFRHGGRAKALLAAAQDRRGTLGDRITGDHIFDAFCSFRGRFHHTHLAQYTLRTPPLLATGLEPCFAALAAPHRAAGFLLYDIMDRLQPGLAQAPYDQPGKSPDPLILPALGRPFEGDIRAGEVFCAPMGMAGRAVAGDALALLLEVYACARALPLRAGLDRAEMRAADRAAAQMQETGKLVPQADFQPVHAVILQGLVAQGQIPPGAQRREEVRLFAQRIGAGIASRLRGR